jgi:hypothetical protein
MVKLVINGIIPFVSLSSCSDDESTQDQVLRLFGWYVNGIKRGSNKQLYQGTATLKFNNTKVFTITVTHDLSSITSDTSKELLEQMEA